MSDGLPRKPAARYRIFERSHSVELWYNAHVVNGNRQSYETQSQAVEQVHQLLLAQESANEYISDLERLVKLAYLSIQWNCSTLEVADPVESFWNWLTNTMGEDIVERWDQWIRDGNFMNRSDI